MWFWIFPMFHWSFWWLFPLLMIGNHAGRHGIVLTFTRYQLLLFSKTLLLPGIKSHIRQELQRATQDMLPWRNISVLRTLNFWSWLYVRIIYWGNFPPLLWSVFTSHHQLLLWQHVKSYTWLLPGYSRNTQRLLLSSLLTLTMWTWT